MPWFSVYKEAGSPHCRTQTKLVRCGNNECQACSNLSLWGRGKPIYSSQHPTLRGRKLSRPVQSTALALTEIRMGVGRFQHPIGWGLLHTAVAECSTNSPCSLLGAKLFTSRPICLSVLIGPKALYCSLPQDVSM